ncbi:helix-turn-helix domain-containing protein [Anabaena sphaerica]|uniref:helix-turn-helix domain-containing protein n=1 Tax=Anabaena sphaerica TaxID=212446 RepID=UPI001685DB2B|nr:helix-turn-helix transcriptional regulator [Anabaena sphaerica]
MNKVEHKGISKVVKRAKKNKEAGEAFKKLLKDKNFSQYKLEQVTGIDKSVISKIVNGYTAEPKLETLEKIAIALGVGLPQLTEIFTSSNTNSSYSTTNPQPQELVSEVLKFKDPDFLGRDQDIEKLNNLVNKGAKVILIKAEGGIGKTTLAEKWFKIQGLEYLKLSVGTTSQNLQSVEEWVRLKLLEYKVNPANNFMTMLEQFKTQLKKQKIGIFIDNLEPALKNGEFIETHRLYVDLLGVLIDKNIQAITLITSREQIYDHKISSSPNFHNYDLEGLNQETWQEYFENKEIKIHSDSLDAIWRNYGGNAVSMSLLAADILKESQGDLKAYWKSNSQDLLRHPSVEQLVQSQFDKLKNDHFQAYRLLCRFGGYPEQNIILSKTWLFYLLWDVPNNRRQRIIDELISRSLLKQNCYNYFLVPVIRSAAIDNFSQLKELEAENLIFLKNQFDNLVHSEKYQKFLRWINNKSLEKEKLKNKPAVRALFFEIDFILQNTLSKSNTINNNLLLQLQLAISIDKQFKFGLEMIGNFDYNYHADYFDYWDYYDDIIITPNQYLDAYQKFNIAYVVVELQELIWSICYENFNRYIHAFSLEGGIIDRLKELIKQIPNKNSILWYQQLRNLLIKYRDIAHDWNFTDEEKSTLIHYYNVNILLVRCLQSDCNASPEVRSHIEDTLLLPIEEIEKHPFNN